MKLQHGFKRKLARRYSIQKSYAKKLRLGKNCGLGRGLKTINETTQTVNYSSVLWMKKNTLHGLETVELTVEESLLQNHIEMLDW